VQRSHGAFEAVRDQLAVDDRAVILADDEGCYLGFRDQPSKMKGSSMTSGPTLEERCRLAFLQGISDQELRSGRPRMVDELRRALLRYPVYVPRPERARIQISPPGQ
jgi:hypothetical protein